jgi:hypothetical protein
VNKGRGRGVIGDEGYGIAGLREGPGKDGRDLLRSAGIIPGGE